MNSNYYWVFYSMLAIAIGLSIFNSALICLHEYRGRREVTILVMAVVVLIDTQLPEHTGAGRVIVKLWPGIWLAELFARLVVRYLRGVPETEKYTEPKSRPRPEPESPEPWFRKESPDLSPGSGSRSMWESIQEKHPDPGSRSKKKGG